MQDNCQAAITCSKLTKETLEQRCEICSKLTIKTPKRRQWRRFGVFIVNSEQFSHLCSSVPIANSEHINSVKEHRETKYVVFESLSFHLTTIYQFVLLLSFITTTPKFSRYF